MAKREQYNVEIPINCSISVLYGLLATSSGLSEWFADKVDAIDDELHFHWDDSTDVAVLLKEEENQSVRYRWDWMDESEFFEFNIETSSITGETILHIIDYADKGDEENQASLWESQIETLKRRVGA
jgi:hypothetical protein